jgi:hypothetical protein
MNGALTCFGGTEEKPACSTPTPPEGAVGWVVGSAFKR